MRHPYHLVTPSPWPFFAGIAVLQLALGGVMYIHSYRFGGFFLFYGFFLVSFVMFIWWRDVIREATFLGCHTKKVQKGLRLGFLLFLVSEVMFFFGFFWAFFTVSLAPAIEIGGVWPPVSITPINPYIVPFYNTVVLLSSGITITWAHHSIVAGRRIDALIGLFLTIILSIKFTSAQYFEYIHASFDISDSVYGSIFYLTTGFHGVHVIIGTIFIIVGLCRTFTYQITKDHHFGVEAAIWYWHFVDVVWIFLYVTIYLWGSYQPF